MTSRSEYRTAFGRALDNQLRVRGVSQRKLAETAGVSSGYLNHTMKGRKTVSARFADTVADTLALTEVERVALHRAAASDAGFKLDLTTKD